MNDYVEELVSHRKFMDLPEDDVDAKLKEEKKANPKSIPYALCWLEMHPGYASLRFVASSTPRNHIIGISPKGFLWNSIEYPNLDLLINGFKKNPRGAAPKPKEPVPKPQAPKAPSRPPTENRWGAKPPAPALPPAPVGWNRPPPAIPPVQAPAPVKVGWGALSEAPSSYPAAITVGWGAPSAQPGTGWAPQRAPPPRPPPQHQPPPPGPPAMQRPPPPNLPPPNLPPPPMYHQPPPPRPPPPRLVPNLPPAVSQAPAERGFGGDLPASQDPGQGRGRGRGRTLPAWMSKGQ